MSRGYPGSAEDASKITLIFVAVSSSQIPSKFERQKKKRKSGSKVSPTETTIIFAENKSLFHDNDILLPSSNTLEGTQSKAATAKALFTCRGKVT